MGLLSSLSFRKRGPQPVPVGAEAAPATVSAAGPVEETAPDSGHAPPTELVPSAADRAAAEKLVRRVAHELPAFVTVAVLDAATGTILAGQWAGHSGGAREVATANTEVVRQTRLAIEALHLAATEQLTDILITLRQQLHLLRVLPQAGWLLYLAVRTQDTNPALLRAVAQLVDS